MNEFSTENFKYRISQLDEDLAALNSGNYLNEFLYESRNNGYQYLNRVRDYSESGNFVYIADINSTRFLNDIMSSGFHRIKNESVNKLVYYPGLNYTTSHKFSTRILDFSDLLFDKKYADYIYRDYYDLLSYDEDGENLEIITNKPDILSQDYNPNFYINSPIFLFESNYHEMQSLNYEGYSKGLSLLKSNNGELVKNITDLKHVNKIHQNDKYIYFGGLSTDYDIFSDNYDSYNRCEYLITKQYDLLSNQSGKITYQNLFNNYQNNFEISINHDSVTKIAGHFPSGSFDLFYLAKNIKSNNILEYIPPGFLRQNISTVTEFYDDNNILSRSFINTIPEDLDTYSLGYTALFNHKGLSSPEEYYYKNIESVNSVVSGIMCIQYDDTTEEIKQKIASLIGYEPEVYGDIANGELFIVSKGIMDYDNYYKMTRMEDFEFTRRELRLFSRDYYNHIKGDIVTYGCINSSGDNIWMNRHGSNTIYNYHNQSGDYYTITPNRLGEIYSISEPEDSGVVVFGGNLVKEYDTKTFESGTLRELSLLSDLGYYSDFRYPVSIYNIPNEEVTSSTKQKKYKIENFRDRQNLISDIKCLKHNSLVSQSILYHSGNLNLQFPTFNNLLEASGY